MREEILAHLEAVMDRISMLARKDAEFRQHLRALGRAATALAEECDREDRAQQTAVLPDPKVVEAVAALGDRLRDNAIVVPVPSPVVQPERTEERPPRRGRRTAPYPGAVQTQDRGARVVHAGPFQRRRGA